MTSQLDSRELIIDAIRDRKGRAITLVDLEHIPGASARAFIIAEGSSVTQVGSIADHLRDRLLDDAGLKPYNADGRQNAEWVVMDYGDIWYTSSCPRPVSATISRSCGATPPSPTIPTSTDHSHKFILPQQTPNTLCPPRTTTR